LPLILPIVDAMTLSAPGMAQTLYRDRVESGWEHSAQTHRSSQWIRRGTIEDSTLVQPVIIDSEIEDSTLINPVIVEPRSSRSRIVHPNSRDRIYHPGHGEDHDRVYRSLPPASGNPSCVDFASLRLVCQQ
jgi:hypothetical protein